MQLLLEPVDGLQQQNTEQDMGSSTGYTTKTGRRICIVCVEPQGQGSDVQIPTETSSQTYPRTEAG